MEVDTTGCGNFIKRHTVYRLYRFLLLYGYMGSHWMSVCMSVHPSISPTSDCLSVRISFPDDNLSKHQWIFTKLGMCIYIVEIWFGIANEQISSNFDGVICPRHAHIFVFGPKPV